MLILAVLAAFLDTTVVMTRSIVVAPGESLAVAIAGAGKPVVFIPGLVGGLSGFRRVQLRAVEAGFQSVVVEPLGVGHSGRPRDADYSLTAQAERIATVLDSLGLGEAIVVAHSLGASIAFRLSLRRPELVAGIVSLDGGPAERAGTPGLRRAVSLAPLIRLLGGRRIIRGRVRDALVKGSADPSWVTEEAVDAYVAGPARDIGTTMHAYRRMVEAVEPESLSSRIRELSAPVVLLTGSVAHSGMVGPAELEVLRTRLPAFSVEEVPGAAHYVHEERPESVVAVVARLAESRRVVVGR